MILLWLGRLIFLQDAFGLTQILIVVFCLRVECRTANNQFDNISY
jgi:hypothetical protein